VSENIDEIITSSRHTCGLEEKNHCFYSVNCPTPEVVPDVGQWAYTTDTIDAADDHREVRRPPGGVVFFSWTKTVNERVSQTVSYNKIVSRIKS